MKSQKFRESQLNLCFHQFLTNFLMEILTSNGSKNFSMGIMVPFKVFKRLLKIRNVQRTSILDPTNRRNGGNAHKARQRQNLVFQSNLVLLKSLSFYSLRNFEFYFFYKNQQKINPKMYMFSEKSDQELSRTASILFMRHFWTILDYIKVKVIFSGIEYVSKCRRISRSRKNMVGSVLES